MVRFNHIVLSIATILVTMSAAARAENLPEQLQQQQQQKQHVRVGADPDTSCSDAYRKDPTEDACLATKDHYGRPCQFCDIGGQNTCYNADEARWAKFFGAHCETTK